MVSYLFGVADPTNAPLWRRDWFKYPVIRLCCHYGNTYKKLQSSNQVRLNRAQ